MDVYAVGCIMMELFTCKCIWKDINNPGQLVAKIIWGEYPCTDELRNHAVKELVQCCFRESSERITMSELASSLDGLLDKEKF